MDKQELRNAFAAVEDAARGLRKHSEINSDQWQLANLIARLTQLVREDIVK